MNSIITRDGWLNGKTVARMCPAGVTLGELADKNMPAALRTYVRAQRNGEPMDNWEQHIPCNDEHIVLYIVPQGGGGEGGKSSVLAVVGIAIAIFAPYAAPAIAGALGSSQFIGAAVYWVGASLVMNSLAKALIKPPQQQSAVNYDRSSNPFLYFSGIGNRMEPWGNVIRVYGRMRIYPKLIVPPLQRTIGGQTYFYLAFDLGYGPLRVTNEKIGENLLANYQDVISNTYHNFTKDSSLSLFRESPANSVVNQELLPASGNLLTATTAIATYQAVVTLAFPNGLYRVHETTGAYYGTSVSIFVEARPVTVPASPWVDINTLAYRQESTKLKRPVFAPLLAYGFLLSLQTWQENGIWYTGIPDGTTSLTMRLYDATAINLSHWEVGNTVWIGFNTNLTGKIAAWGTILSFVGGDKARPVISWGGRGFIYNSFTSAASVPVSPGTFVQMHLRTHDLENRQLSWVTFDPITDGFAMEINFYFIDNQDQYEIRIRNTGLDQDQYYRDQVLWINLLSYTGIAKKVFLPEAPHTVVEMRIRASNQLSGMIDDYNVIAESFLPVWNGVEWQYPEHDAGTNQWNMAPTRNPAWIYLDVLRGSANKNPVQDHLLDLDAFLEWANECEAPAPNDPDNPSFNCDLVISSETTVRETLQTIASVGRAAPARRDSKFSVIRHSAEQVPVQLITPKNSRDFAATINYIKPPHGLKVAFIDENDGYSASETIVYNDGYDATNATEFEQLNLPGSTRHNQVWRHGRYYMASAILQRERVKVTMDYEHLVCQRGDMVLVAHDVLKAGGLPRRVNEIIADAGGDMLVLDEAVTAVTAIRYRASDTIIAVSQLGDNEIRLPIGQAPPPLHDLIEYGVSEEIRAPFIVEEITPAENLSASLLLVEDRPEIDDAITQPIPPRVVRPGSDGEYAIGSVTFLEATQETYYAEGQQYSDISLTWLPPELGVPSYYVVYEMMNDVPVWIGRTPENSYPSAKTVNLSVLTDSVNVTLGVQAVVDRVGVGPIEAITVTVSPDTSPPPDVTGFGCNAQTGTLFLFWDSMIAFPDIHHFEIRYTDDTLTGSWGTASLLNDQVPANASDTVVPLRPGIYFIKAVDGAGNYSINAASTVVQIDDLEYVEEFLNIAFAPFDDGTYDRVNNDVPGQLRLNVGEEIGYYYPDPVDYGITLPALSKIRLYANVQGMVIAHESTLDSSWFLPLANAVPLQTPLEVGANAINSQIDFRWKEAPADDWSPWTRLYVADVTAIEIEFRVMLRSRNIEYTPAVSAANIRADWLERTETGSDIAIASGGTRVTFINAFAEKPVVSITLENSHVGDYYLMTNLDRFGFDIELRHSDDAPEAGQIDYMARGYGKEY